MRVALPLLAVSLLTACASHAPDAPAPMAHPSIPDVNWVKVSGNSDAVSDEDMAQAIKAFRGIGLKEPALTVISKDEIHAYGQNRDLGWFTSKRVTVVEPDRSEHPGWDAYGRGLPEYTEALECMWNAEQIYVFPVNTPLNPHRDDTHLRLLEGEARRQLVQLLGDADHWLTGGFNNLMYPPGEKPGVGFLFRNSKHELVLFVMHSDVLVGTFDGEHLSGTLDMESDHRKWERELQEWTAKYAQAALGTHRD